MKPVLEMRCLEEDDFFQTGSKLQSRHSSPNDAMTIHIFDLFFCEENKQYIDHLYCNTTMKVVLCNKMKENFLTNILTAFT